MKIDLTPIAEQFDLDLRDLYTRTLALAFYWQDKYMELRNERSRNITDYQPAADDSHEIS